MDIYIQAAEQISIQEPLSDAWFDAPIIYNRTHIRAIDPNYKDYLAPNMARRMGKILKRAIVTSRTAVQHSGIEMPDAIIGGTGLGCIEDTEGFLAAMVKNGEELLQPALFIQSTHNTISSQVAIDLKCHGYNSTHVHRGVSFESALEDAWLQFCEKKIKSALVGGYDEMSDYDFLKLSRIGNWRIDSEDAPLKRGEEAFAGETLVSFMLSTEKTEQTICRIGGITLLYKPSENDLQLALNELLTQNNFSLNDIDAVFVGVSGNKKNDAVYDHYTPLLFEGKPLVSYKHIFGESYTATALGMYAATTCLRKQRIPQHIRLNNHEDINQVKALLLYNHSEGKNHSLTLLTSC